MALFTSPEEAKQYAKTYTLPLLKEIFPNARLGNALEMLARQEGFAGWRAYKAHMETSPAEGIVARFVRQARTHLDYEWLAHDALDAEDAITRLFQNGVLTVRPDQIAAIIAEHPLPTHVLFTVFNELDSEIDTAHKVLSIARRMVAVAILEDIGHAFDEPEKMFFDYVWGCLVDYTPESVSLQSQFGVWSLTIS